MDFGSRSDAPNPHPRRLWLGAALAALTTLASVPAHGVDGASPAATGRATTINLVKDWVPVVSEFRVVPGRIGWDETTRRWVTIAMPKESKGPSSIPRAWKELEKMLTFGEYGRALDPVFATAEQRQWPDKQPVISAWTTWSKVQEGVGIESGIQVMRSDEPDQAAWKEVVPLYATPKQEGIQIGLQIWGAGRLEDEPDLTPADDEYQRRILEKVAVLEFDLKAYRLAASIPSSEEGGWTKEIRSEVATDKVVDLMDVWKKTNFGYTHLGHIFKQKGMDSRGGVLFLRLGDIPELSKPGLYEIRLRARLLFRDFGAEIQSDDDDGSKEKIIQARIRYGVAPGPRARGMSIETGRGGSMPAPPSR